MELYGRNSPVIDTVNEQEIYRDDDYDNRY